MSVILRLSEEIRVRICSIPFKNKGFGKLMIKFAISEADRLSEEVGCRFVYLDSYLNKIDLYKELGFVECAEKEQEMDGKRYYVTMCYDLLS